MSDNDNQITPKESPARTFNEELEVAGNQLVERVKELLEQGNIRRLIIRNSEGRTLLEIPLTFGAVAGGALVFWNPLLAALAVIGALVARLRIEIVRNEPDVIDQDVNEAKRKIEDVTEE